MRETVIHIPSFQGQYKTGLVFAMIEGLKDGERFKLICDQNPSELEMLLDLAKIPHLSWAASALNSGGWELLIEKEDPYTSNQCCGICGEPTKKAQGG